MGRRYLDLTPLPLGSPPETVTPMAEALSWYEPQWSAQENRARLRSVPAMVWHEAGAILCANLLVGLLCVAVLYLCGQEYRQWIPLVLSISLGLPLVCVLLASLRVMLGWISPASHVSIRQGHITVNGREAFSAAKGDTAELQVTPEGRRWLVIRRRTTEVRIGIPDEVTQDIQSLLAPGR